MQQYNDIHQSIEAFTRLVQSFSDLYPKAPIAVFGFSQGGVMSVRALHLAPHLYRAVASLSGYWMDHNYMSNKTISKMTRSQKPSLSTAKPIAKPIAKRPLPQLMVAHGKQDRIVPFTEAKKLQSKFINEGYPVKFLSFDGAHRIPKNVIQDLIDFLSQAFKSQ